MVGTMSIAWWYWCANLALCPAVAEGQEMMHGSAVPPLNS